MKGDAKIIEALNTVLASELTAINQYFLHARMLQDWGLEVLGKLEYEASLDEMRHADEIIKRILFLEGLPNLQKLNRLRIGQDVKEIVDCDLEVEYEAVPQLKEFIILSESKRDFVTRDLFLSILKSEEHHVDWLETQKGLIEKVGLQNYMQSQIDMNKTAEH